MLPEGTIFGPYRILHLLGRGGMGIVYAAEEVESGRQVALKVIAAPLRSQGERDRFLREGQLAASINHPNCVYVFGAYEIDGSSGHRARADAGDPRRSPASRRPVADRGGGGRDASDCSRARGRGRERHPASRYQAVELLHRRARTRQDRRFRNLAIAASGYRCRRSLPGSDRSSVPQPTPPPNSCVAPRSTRAVTSIAWARRCSSC